MEIDWKRAWYFISQILSILGFAFFGLLVSHSVAFYAGQQYFKCDAQHMQAILSNPPLEPSVAMFLRLYQMATNLGTFGIPVIIYLIVYKYPVFSTLQLNKGISVTKFLGTVLFAVAAIFGMSLLSEINHWLPLPESVREAAQRMDETQEKLIRGMMFMPSSIHLLANLIVVGLVAAISEELMFRGLLQPFFKNWTQNIHLGIIISASIFSAIHFDLSNFIPRMAIGIAFGYLFYWSGSLWVTILAHFLNNSIEVMIFYYKDNSWCNYFLEVKYMPVMWGIGAMAIIGGVMFLFYKKHKSSLPQA